MTSLEGLVLVDKPSGITSHDVVDRVRRSLGTRKVGHAGTLDPMATGLMLLGVGRATRLLRYLSGLDKAYEGTARLGESTDTLDATGKVVATAPVDSPSEDLERALASLTGEIEQIPPAFSAVKVGGEVSYDAARRGEALELRPRKVTVRSFSLLRSEPPDFDFSVECSSGTYVRVLVADAGAMLGCGAHLTRLVRTRVGPFDLSDARDIEDLGRPLPLERAVAHLPRIDVNEHEAEAASHGRALGPAGIEGPYCLFAPDGDLVAVYRDEHAKAVPEMVLAAIG